MSSPSPPKQKKVNPYTGINTDPEIYRAQQDLGINKIKNDKHMGKINDQIILNRYSDGMGDPAFKQAAKDLDFRSVDKQSELDQIYARMEENTYEEQNEAQQKQLEEQYERMRADQLEDAETQRELMEEMMNQPVYMPQQGAPPRVQKPTVKSDPLLPAPMAPTPMQIGPPPAPELTAAANKMAIIRTPKSTKARQRRATRGTSSLINRWTQTPRPAMRPWGQIENNS